MKIGLQKYWLIWWKIAQYAIAETLLSRWTSALFLLGKSLRTGMLIFFLLLIEKNIKQFAGYTTDQMIVFYLSYQFLDTFSQLVYRGVYSFSWQVRSGELDFYLSKPINPLFRILTGKPDILDAIFIVPTTILSIWIMAHLSLNITFTSAVLYGLLLVNGFLIATALHILVVCLGILTTEVDNAIMLYRDINNLARFPVSIYQEPLRSVLFFLVPVGLMNTIPAQVLLNEQPSYGIFAVCLFGVGFLAMSLLAWRMTIRKYTSAGG